MKHAPFFHQRSGPWYQLIPASRFHYIKNRYQIPWTRIPLPKSYTWLLLRWKRRALQIWQGGVICPSITSSCRSIPVKKRTMRGKSSSVSCFPWGSKPVKRSVMVFQSSSHSDLQNSIKILTASSALRAWWSNINTQVSAIICALWSNLFFVFIIDLYQPNLGRQQSIRTYL